MNTKNNATDVCIVRDEKWLEKYAYVFTKKTDKLIRIFLKWQVFLIQNASDKNVTKNA